MHRVFPLGIVVLLALGCASVAERATLKPLPEDSPPPPYGDMLTRARTQANLANDAFYVNNWTDMEDAAKGLEQTARLLPKVTDVPAKQKDILPVISADLAKEAGELREAIKTQDVKKSNEIMQRIHLKVRELRLDN
ncbi:MAG: hypothetical protein ACJ8FY_25140 [Gemmataceae bacterium]